MEMTLEGVDGVDIDTSTEAAGTRPAIRAIAIANLLKYLDRYSFGLQRDVRALMPERADYIPDDGNFRSWVSVEDCQEVLTAIWSVLGPEQALDAVACCIERFLRSPFLTRLVPRAGTVTEVFYALQLGWDLIYRDICSVHVVHVDDSEIKIRLLNVNEEAFYSAEYLHSFAAICLGVLRREELECKVFIAKLDCETRSVDYVVSWKGTVTS
jgi:hypothetical protein